MRSILALIFTLSIICLGCSLVFQLSNAAMTISGIVVLVYTLIIGHDYYNGGK